MPKTKQECHEASLALKQQADTLFAAAVAADTKGAYMVYSSLAQKTLDLAATYSWASQVLPK